MLFKMLGLQWAGRKRRKPQVLHCQLCKKKVATDEDGVIEKGDGHYHYCRRTQVRAVKLVPRKERDLYDHLTV